MKSTHLHTPRSLAECHLQPSMDPIEPPEKDELSKSDLIVIVGSLVAAVAAAVLTRWGCV